MKLYVRNKRKQAATLIESLGFSTKEVFPTGICNALTGYRFDVIIMDVEFDKLTHLKQIQFLDWKEKVLSSKLKPNGKIIFIQ